MPKDLLSIALTPGAENGVGPELLVKAAALIRRKNIRFIWCLDRHSLLKAAKHAGSSINVINQNTALLTNGLKITFFNDTPAYNQELERQAWALKKAVEIASSIDAIVTGPIEKAALSFLGDFVGQTEFFAAHLGKATHKPFMAFMGGPFLLSLVTTHLPLAKVASAIDQEKLLKHFYALSAAIKQKDQAAKIIVLGLNPHAGENGLLGKEEQEIIIPAINEAKSKGLDIEGPVGADGFFAYFNSLPKKEQPQAVVAMYHDQGLAPYKVLAKARAVNVTFGLNIPRVSPAHGTASKLRGLNIACPKSTMEALRLAIKLARKV